MTRPTPYTGQPSPGHRLPLPFGGALPGPDPAILADPLRGDLLASLGPRFTLHEAHFILAWPGDQHSLARALAERGFAFTVVEARGSTWVAACAPGTDP